MDLNYKLNFGKYKNKSILHVWNGNFEQLDNDLIKDYICEFLDFVFGKLVDSRILSNGYSFTQEDILFIEFLMTKKYLRDQILVNKSRIKILISDKVVSEKLSKFLFNFFNYKHFSEPDFNSFKNPYTNDLELKLTRTSEILSDIIPDPNYIIWCITESKMLKFNIEELEQLYKIDSLYPVINLYQTNENEIQFRLYSYIHKHNSKN